MFFPHIIDSLLADASRYAFKNIYLDYDFEKKRKVDEVKFLSDLVYERTSRYSVSFTTAPYYEDFSFGISLINSYLERGLLTLSGNSLALQQLRELKRAELAPGEGETKYNALNALRFVLEHLIRSNRCGRCGPGRNGKANPIM